MEIRLQKILSQAGLGSRRKCEELIRSQQVTVNGKTASLGSKADPSKDRIEVSGKLIRGVESHKYIALNKPRNVISASGAMDSRKSVIDLVNVASTLYPVGRLDVDSEGLILLTNDGELTYQLTHPSFMHEKEYKVYVACVPDDKQLAAWRNGVVLKNGYRTKPAQIQILDSDKNGSWIQVILTEGKKRQIREMGWMTGMPVKRIIRVRIGPLRLGNLKPGQWRYLSSQEVELLKKISRDERGAKQGQKKSRRAR